MKQKTVNKKNYKTYEKKNPKKSSLIKMAVKRGLKDYAETFRRLAAN